MMKKFYVSTWWLLAAAVLVTVLNGSFNSTALLIFSLVVSALFSASAMRSVMLQVRNLGSW